MKENQSSFFSKEGLIKFTAKTVVATSIAYGVGMTDNVGEISADTGVDVKPIVEKTNYDSTQNFNNTLAALGVRIENSNYSSEFPTRIAGKDRYDTAVEIAKQGWGNTGSKNVVLSYGGSNEECLAEAIASGPLANALKAPILLTDGTTLSSATIKEIKDLGATTIYITSRKSIIKQSVLDQLNGFTIKSVYGNDSPSTSVEIAKTIATISGKKFDTFALANGKVGTPDVLSISPIASAKGFPILLTDNTKELPKVVKDYLATLSTTKAYVVGGTAVVDDNQKSELVNPIRLAGMDRYDTNTAIIKDFCTDGSINLDHVFVANGVSLVDAISGVTMAANFNAAIVLTDGFIAEAADIVNPLISENGKVTALGGTAVVPSRILKTIGHNVEPEPIAVDAIDIEATKKAFKFMAGGEYADIYNSSLLIFTDPISKCTVVFEDKYYEDLDGQLSYLKDGSLTGEQLNQKYVENSGISKISGLTPDNVVFRNNDGAYVFGEDNLKSGNRSINKFDKNGNKTIVTDNLSGTCNLAVPGWDKNIGVCLSDGTRITHKLNGNSFEELVNPIMIGTQEQRMKHIVKSLYDGNYRSVNNLFNLDVNEVNKYLDTGSDEGLKSFQVVKSQQESFIMVTGGQWGLNELFAKTVRAAVKRSDEIDPNIMKEVVEKNGLQTVTYDAQTEQFFKTFSGWSATFTSDSLGRTIYLNQDRYTKYLGEYSMDNLIEIICPDIMECLWVESRGLYGLDNIKFENLFNGVELDKNTWLLNKTEQYKDKLTKPEYIHIHGDAMNNIDVYKNR
ncbi:MAG: cell wall-binding repeat-containing protein [Candidatus Shapirobacteria bacterium]|jgi:putative cell wall-binding protein